MKYLGFARKYRPQNFSQVVGQKEIAAVLENTLRNKHEYHAYLFFGPRGVGKTSMARILAKAFNCKQGPTPIPCNECDFCKRISVGEDVDVLEIDGASTRGIDEIRALKESTKYLPANARYKIFIIDEVHMLTMQAFNALLKILEEPPAYIKFIFATTEIHEIPETILSRCQRFNFNQITMVDVIAHLQEIAKKENLVIEDGVLEKLARRSGGALRDSLVLLEQLATFGDGKIDHQALQQITGTALEDAQGIISALIAQEPVRLLGIIRTFITRGGHIGNLLDCLIQGFRDLLVINLAPDQVDWIEGTPEYQGWIVEQKTKVQPDFLHTAIRFLLDAKTLLRRANLDRIVLETTLLKILRMDSLFSLKVVTDQLTQLEQRLYQKVGEPVFPPLVPRLGVASTMEAAGVVLAPPEPKKIKQMPAQEAQTSASTLPTKPPAQESSQLQAQPTSVQAQPASVQAQPTSVQAQPTSVQAQPTSVQAQPTSVQAQPTSAQAQPTVQAQPASVQAQPTVQASVQAQPTVQTQPVSVQAQPVRVQTQSEPVTFKKTSQPPTQLESGQVANKVESRTSEPTATSHVLAPAKTAKPTPTPLETTQSLAQPMPGNPWDIFVTEVSKEYPHIHTMLAVDTKYEIKEQILLIRLPPGSAILVSNLQNKKTWLNRIAQQAFAQKLTVAFEVQAAGTPPELDPVTLKVIEFFGGKIVRA